MMMAEGKIRIRHFNPIRRDNPQHTARLEVALPVWGWSFVAASSSQPGWHSTGETTRPHVGLCRYLGELLLKQSSFSQGAPGESGQQLPGDHGAWQGYGSLGTPGDRELKETNVAVQDVTPWGAQHCHPSQLGEEAKW